MILLILIILFYLSFYEKFTNTNPCDKYLSDYDYLHHMIPHHQVAIDISLLFREKTKNPVLKEILRKIIWTQTIEIELMKMVLSRLPKNISDSHVKMNRIYINTPVEAYYPKESSVKVIGCNPHFFDSKLHMKHLKHKKLTDKYFLEHMIPHHQLAVDMSKRLLKHTKSDYMIEFCYRIIRSQTEEIFMMKNMLKNYSTWQFQSDLV